MKGAKYLMFSVLKDRVTGFKGMVLGISLEDSGCHHYGICPQSLDKDGQPQKWHWFDESRLSLVKAPDLEAQVTWDIQFGMRDEVEDILTGIRGKITTIVEYDTGCVSYALTQKGTHPQNGSSIDPDYIESSRLKLIKSAKPAAEPAPKPRSPYGSSHPSSDYSR